MKHLRLFTIAALALSCIALGGCAGAPVTSATTTFCASLPTARLAVDIAIARGTRVMTAEDLASMKAVRALEDARCAEAAAAASAPK